MENNDNLFLLNHPDYDDIHRMCSDAYTKGSYGRKVTRY